MSLVLALHDKYRCISCNKAIKIFRRRKGRKGKRKKNIGKDREGGEKRGGKVVRN
jgi:hypothetical protein